MARRIYLTDREWQWLWEFTWTGSNASQAARIAFGRTPMSVRVKGYKLKKKPILDTIDRKWNQWLVRTPDGHTRMGKDLDQIEREVDAYLRRLRRRMSKGYT